MFKKDVQGIRGKHKDNKGFLKKENKMSNPEGLAKATKYTHYEIEIILNKMLVAMEVMDNKITELKERVNVLEKDKQYKEEVGRRG